MRKAVLIIILVSVLSVSLSGCFGNFALTRKVYDLNRSFSDQGIRSLVMWIMFIIPVYEFAVLVDVVLLNLIQYWTGSNPLSMGEDQTEVRLYAHEDRFFEITASRDRYDIMEVDNPENSLSFVFERAENSWYLYSQDRVIKITEENHRELKLFDLDGMVLSTM